MSMGLADITTEYVDLVEGARILGVHNATLRRYAQRKSVPAIMRHGRWLFAVVELQQFKANYLEADQDARVKARAGLFDRVRRCEAERLAWPGGPCRRRPSLVVDGRALCGAHARLAAHIPD